MLCGFVALVAVLWLQGAPVYVPYAEGRDLPARAGSHLQISAEDWPAWVAKRDGEIRGRLARGDEDSLVYLWLYGTSFTRQPRATADHLARLADPAKAEGLLIDRLHDFVRALAAPARNERLQFARAHLKSKGIDAATPAGKLQAMEYLVKARERVVAENADFRRIADAAQRATGADGPPAYTTLFRDRGLSSDTRLAASFAIDTALKAIAEARLVPAAGVRRAAVVGPGLDFTDKAEGYDFYPQQTIQPFALVDSLLRLQLARIDEVRLTTYDLSPRVNTHLTSAVARAARGSGYTVQLPLTAADPSHEWQPDLVSYWRTFGAGIGRAAAPAPLPRGLSGIRVRSVTIRPPIVRAIAVKDLNVVLQREPLAESNRFDLLVATNVLVYYDAFEQALALANIASMLKPGGLLLTNTAIAPSEEMELLRDLTTIVFFDKQGNGDSVFCYRRR